jgi:hypothetical protein
MKIPRKEEFGWQDAPDLKSTINHQPSTLS